MTQKQQRQCKTKVNYHNEHHYAVENPHCRKEVRVQGRL